MLTTISEEDETLQEALVEPLLVSNSTYNRSKITEDNPAANSEAPDESSSPLSVNSGVTSVEMASTNLAGSPSSGPSLGRRLTDIRFCPPAIQGILFRLLAVKSVADSLPFPFNHIVTNGKITAPIYLGANVALFLIWLPFWLLSYAITEWGIYLITVGSIFLIGRSIIRFIAFPGASRKMTLDMEREFSKYALRMLIGAAESCRETASCLLQASSANSNQSAKEMLPAYWKRTETYRNRVLAVFAETLNVLYQQQNAESFQIGDLTRYGNNRLSGDVGDLSSITPEARASGRELMQHLQQLLESLNDLEAVITSFTQQGGIFSEGVSTAKTVLQQSNNLLAFCESLRHASSEEAADADNDDGDVEDPVETIQRQMEEGNKSTWDAVSSGLSSLQTMLDPHPHKTVFCMDFQRGCVLSRFRRARQIWVRRPSGGMVDVLHFPASGVANNKKAVLYCNPNAGLMEVATGLNMVGGNVPAAEADPSAPKDSWTDFYLAQSFDVYLFNYAGYGRSYGPGVCSSSASEYVGKSCLARCRRIFDSTFLAFKPRPETLRADGIAVAEEILSGGVEKLVIHGESIGGMAASGVAKHLTNKPSTRSKVSLLICDRTFCNLEAIAQRLVGEWTGNAIRTLTFNMWSTDVAGDFLKSQCPKVLANDAGDAIIADDASLKSGVALWKEVHKGIVSTAGIAWMKEIPLRYRMADFENASVDDAKYVSYGSPLSSQPPMWPTDKHVSLPEALHFAACCKRIGKSATAMKRTISIPGDENQNSLNNHLLIQAWKHLATCDGLVGAPLGGSVKRGFDASTAWLCSTLVFGGQIVVQSAQNRLGELPPGQAIVIDASDFDQTPPEDKAGALPEGFAHPTPIPSVASFLEQTLESSESQIQALAHEIKYVAATLRYVQARLSAATSVQHSLGDRQLRGSNDSNVGSFLNLHCGHNNAYSNEEKEKLRALIQQAEAASNHP